MKYQLELTYKELVDEMIADAWYMVTEYHLNLGPKDTLESLVTLIKQKNPELKSKEEKTVIIDFLKNTEDKELMSKKRALTYNVPYRLQSPFLENLKGKDWNVGETKLIEKINQENRLIYYFTALNGLATKIIIQKDWAEYIVKNQQIIWGWLEYNMILYIQKRNPNVPGIADKLYPPKERKLEKIKNYWKLILSLEPIREIYGDEILTEQNISIDHFVPWSYVAHAVIFILYKPVGNGIIEKVLKNTDSRIERFISLATKVKHPYRVGFDTCFTPALLRWGDTVPAVSIDACEAATFSMYIDSQMNCYPCSFGIWDKSISESMNSKALREIWQGDKFVAFREQRKEKCSSCRQTELCRGGCRLGIDIDMC